MAPNVGLAQSHHVNWACNLITRRVATELSGQTSARSPNASMSGWIVPS